MPEISVRGLEMPESPIRKLAPLAADAKKRGVKVYHLNIGQPDLPTPQVGLDALKHIDRTILEYSPSQGYLSYRQKLVDYYKKYNIMVTADDIIITSGGSEAVLFAFMSCLNPGDEILCPQLLIPTILPLLYQRAPRYAPLLPPLKRASRCQRLKSLRSLSMSAHAPS